MCILVGAAGHIPTEHQEEFYKIMSRAFALAERGGRSASGFSALRNNELIWEKEPMRAPAFIRASKLWQDFRNNFPQMVICHGRGAMSDAQNNLNNHPHVGEYASIIHEGWINGHVGIAKKLGLTLKSECDSELVMQIVDAADDVIAGLQSVIDNCSTGSLSTAVIDKREPSNLFLATGRSGSKISIFKSEKFKCAVFATRPAIFAGIADFKWAADVEEETIVSLAKHDGSVEICEPINLEDF